jgi:hypothetical protein
MSDLMRDEIKYIRDISKSKYNKATECRICQATEELQLHHYYSLTNLWLKWKKDKGVKAIDSVEQILVLREEFKSDHTVEIYDETVTLCKVCHIQLHKVYGQAPTLITAPKQKRWVERIREKRINEPKKLVS